MDIWHFILLYIIIGHSFFIWVMYSYYTYTEKRVKFYRGLWHESMKNVEVMADYIIQYRNSSNKGGTENENVHKKL